MGIAHFETDIKKTAGTKLIFEAIVEDVDIKAGLFDLPRIREISDEIRNAQAFPSTERGSGIYAVAPNLH